MKQSRCSSPSTGLRFLVAALALVLGSSCAVAAPITYTGFLITDGQLGKWSFHNARVILTFESDTTYVQTLDATCVGTTAAYNPTGAARVTIVDHERTVTARLSPNQMIKHSEELGSARLLRGLRSCRRPVRIPLPCSLRIPSGCTTARWMRQGTQVSPGITLRTRSPSPTTCRGMLRSAGKGTAVSVSPSRNAILPLRHSKPIMVIFISHNHTRSLITLTPEQ